MQKKSTSYSQMRKEFYQQYQKKIVPMIKTYEKQRKIKLIIAITIALIFAILATLLLIFSFLSGLLKDTTYIELIFGLYAAGYGSWFIIKKNFENTIKVKIMPTVCSCFGNMKWINDDYPYGKNFSASGVIPQYTSESYDDVFEGSYNNVQIDIIESHYEIRSGRSKRTVFKGVIVKLDMNKSFTGHTVIKPNGLLKMPPIANLHHTELEDVQFNQKYDVFTNDDIDARYLLTPTFMERLKSMQTAFEAHNVSCAFYKKFLIIALSTNKDLFSICSLIKPIDDKQQYIQMYEEILSIIKLIDHFKIDQKIGL